MYNVIDRSTLGIHIYTVQREGIVKLTQSCVKSLENFKNIHELFLYRPLGECACLDLQLALERC